MTLYAGDVVVDPLTGLVVSTGLAGLYYTELASTQDPIPEEAPEDFEGDQAEWKDLRLSTNIRQADSLSKQAVAFARALTGTSGELVTPSNVATPALQVDLPENGVVAFRVDITGRGPAGALRVASYHGAVQRVGTAGTSDLTYTADHVAGSGGSAINTSGNGISITVTGTVGLTWTWLVTFTPLLIQT